MSRNEPKFSKNRGRTNRWRAFSSAAAGSLPVLSTLFAILIAMPAPAFAQDPAVLPGNEGTTLTWVVFAGLLVVGCATGFIKSKRSHQH